MNRGVDQIRAIEIGNDLHVGGKNTVIERVDLGVHALEHLRRIVAA